MIDEAIISELKDDPITFTNTMFFRDHETYEKNVLEHDGSVVLVSENNIHGKHDIWRAMYECATNDDFETLFVSPREGMVNGTMLMIEDEIERSPFDEESWGIERTTTNEIEFSNGSRIVSLCAGEGHGGDRVRGFGPDLLIATLSDVGIDDEVEEEVLAPMVINADVWVNLRYMEMSPLVERAIRKGALVQKLDR